MLSPVFANSDIVLSPYILSMGNHCPSVL